MSRKKEHILVIRLGALGDLVFCLPSFHDIRQAHPDAEIALLTRAPFAALAGAMPWFDRIIVETHPRFTHVREWGRLWGQIRNFGPTRIYDLQGKFRQTVLYALLGGPCAVEWSGAAPLCQFPRLWPPTPGMSFRAFLAAQLRLAGVPAASPPDLKWLDAGVEKFALPPRYVVLVAGCSPQALYKRWLPAHYAELAVGLRERGLTSVLIGTKDDVDAATEIKAAASDVVDLTGQTNLFELAGLLRRSVGVIGNDTGPLHLGAALDAPTLALFSGRSDPVWSKPPGEKVAVLQRQNLNDLSVAEVAAAFDLLLQHAENESR